MPASMLPNQAPEPVAGWHHAPPRSGAAERTKHEAQPRGWASWTASQSGLRSALGPSTTWVPPSDRLALHPLDSIRDSQHSLAVA